ncbi:MULTISPECIES: DUF3592 domain-containing protein [Burkholderia]|uniref:DUF3592 domain-containing protein n=1 Tax=Burkholderia TaxID=32008 RepID=UPI0009BF206D|nr:MULTISPECIES: DUF3592 domain-containing protein [Burkholderia]NTX18862.1 DUF3592 domain-containing protein [Burkholderia cepacia]THJ54588.1 DUF3592 domain-containing protein [Burkholderia sp. LS-044]
MTASSTDRPAKPAMNIATVIAMIIGAAVLAFCVVQAYRTMVFLSHASRAPGVVVKSSGHPTIRFETAQGQRIEFVQNGGMDGPPGTVVQVAYDPAAPAETARAATFLAIWGDVLWGLPAGLGFLVLPLFGARFVLTGRYGNAISR